MSDETKNSDETLPEDLKFEAALKELEEIVEKLESGELELESCLEKFSRGTKLVKFCETKLTETSRQLEILQKTGPDSAEFQTFEPDDE